MNAALAAPAFLLQEEAETELSRDCCYYPFLTPASALPCKVMSEPFSKWELCLPVPLQAPRALEEEESRESGRGFEATLSSDLGSLSVLAGGIMIPTLTVFTCFRVNWQESS